MTAPTIRFPTMNPRTMPEIRPKARFAALRSSGLNIRTSDARICSLQVSPKKVSTSTKLNSSSPSLNAPAAEDAVAGAYMRALAEKLGVARSGVLVAYFATDRDWRVWVGDELTSAFLGRPATAADLVEDGAFHHVKETFLNAAQAAGDAAFAAEQKKAPANQPPTETQHLKLQTDALLDRLMIKMESSIFFVLTETVGSKLSPCCFFFSATA